MVFNIKMSREGEMWLEQVKSLCAKVIELLIQSHLSSTQVSSMVSIHETIKKALLQWEETKKDTEMVLDFYSQTEGCHPLLTQRWLLKFTQIRVISAFSQDQADLFLRSIMQLGTVLPKLPTSNLDFKFSLTTGLNWPKNTLTQKYPQNPLQVSLAKGLLSLNCESVSVVPLPEIKQQELGHRPRLTSIEENSDFDKDLENDLSQSTEEPIICLHQLDMTKYKSCQHVRPLTKICNHEHEAIGFIPLSHTICTEECSDFCCSEVSFETESLYTDLFEENQISEDAAISIYKISCEKIARIKLFEGNKIVSVEQLRSSLRRMQDISDLI